MPGNVASIWSSTSYLGKHPGEYVSTVGITLLDATAITVPKDTIGTRPNPSPTAKRAKVGARTCTCLGMIDRELCLLLCLQNATVTLTHVNVASIKSCTCYLAVLVGVCASNADTILLADTAITAKKVFTVIAPNIFHTEKHAKVGNVVLIALPSSHVM